MLEIVFDPIYIAGGIIGSTLKIILENDGKFIIPKIYKSTIDGVERSVLSLGFIGTVVTGVFVAMVADHSFILSIFASMMGSWALERAYGLANRIKNGDLLIWK